MPLDESFNKLQTAVSLPLQGRIDRIYSLSSAQTVPKFAISSLKNSQQFRLLSANDPAESAAEAAKLRLKNRPPDMNRIRCSLSADADFRRDYAGELVSRGWTRSRRGAAGSGPYDAFEDVSRDFLTDLGRLKDPVSTDRLASAYYVPDQFMARNSRPALPSAEPDRVPGPNASRYEKYIWDSAGRDPAYDRSWYRPVRPDYYNVNDVDHAMMLYRHGIISYDTLERQKFTTIDAVAKKLWEGVAARVG